MIGLLYKDFCNLKQQLRLYFGMIAVWAVIAIMNQDAAFLGGLAMMLTLLIPLSAFAFDEKAKWERYALTMPVTRKDLVNSKYVLAVICAVGGIVVTVAAGMFIPTAVETKLPTYLALFALGIILAAIVMPLMFWLGTEKGRIIMMGIMLLPILGSMVLSQLGIPMPSEAAVESLLLFCPVIALALLFISRAISQKIYASKEF